MRSGLEDEATQNGHAELVEDCREAGTGPQVLAIEGVEIAAHGVERGWAQGHAMALAEAG